MKYFFQENPFIFSLKIIEEIKNYQAQIETIFERIKDIG